MEKNIKRMYWFGLIIFGALLLRLAYEFVFDYLSQEYFFTQFIEVMIRFSITALSAIIVLSILMKSEQTPTKLPWLLFLVFEPFIGLALFLTFGREYRYSLRYRKKERLKPSAYLTKEPQTDFHELLDKGIDQELVDIFRVSYEESKHHVYHGDSHAEILTNGHAYYDALKDAIINAKEFIFLQSYIIQTDQIGHEIFDLLKEKRNVKRILLYDAIGSIYLDRSTLSSLENSGVEIIKIDPVKFGFFNTRINYRNHRKVIVIDGEIGFTGGMNIGDEYVHRSKLGFFRDTQVKITGRAVNSLTALFLRDYYSMTGNFLTDGFYKEHTVKTNETVQIVPSGPEFMRPPIRNTYVKMINNARESIYITTPYLALDVETKTSLIIAAKSGVDVRIIIPGKPDKKMVYIVTKSFIEELLVSGIKIYFYEDAFIHSKVFIMDRTIGSIGSYNLDNRSARINFEVTALLLGEAVEQLVKDFDHDLSNSRLIDLIEWKNRSVFHRLIEGVFNIMAPIV
ncbi:MAG: cardiolipin synthase [Candidatus Izemoplasmataceae bacterium]